MRTAVSLRASGAACKWFLFALLVSAMPACLSLGSRGKPAPRASAAPTPNERQKSAEETLTLAGRLRTLFQPAGGTVGIAVAHVETRRSVNVDGDQQLPLYSVFKLPLAVSVLKDVEEGRLQLETKIPVSPDEVVPGWRGNTDLWRNPVERTIRELLKFSIVQSDNTASDKLLKLVGGPKAVTRRVRSLGFGNIYIHSTIREYVNDPKYVNTGSAADLAKLLAQLQNGQILKQPELDVLMQFMRQATTGQRRLRGDLPTGTQVADKTGSGDAGVATNDVGIITLPEGKGHLAIAVLVSGSKLPAEAQEDLIAAAARMVYDDYVSTPAATTK